VEIQGAAAFATLVACVTFVGASQQPPFQASVDLVHMPVTVSEKRGGLVEGLTADDFEIYEDGRKQAVRYFAAGVAGGEGPVLHLGLLLDVSESMGEDMRFSKTASIRFLNTLTDAVDITVVDFDTEIRTARYSQSDYARLIERIRLKKAGGFTALYDAIGTYLDDAAGQDGRKIMLVYTDGGDTHSSIGFRALIDLLKASDVTVYAIGELEHQSSSGKSQQRAVLQQIADVTGGQAFFPAAIRDLDRVYEQVLAQIHAQYTLGYLSTNEKTDGTWRKVEVRIARKDSKDLRVRSRQGYFARYRK
jgi:Ca-activated chloride channel family protein